LIISSKYEKQPLGTPTREKDGCSPQQQRYRDIGDKKKTADEISSGIGLITFIASLLLLDKWRRLCFKLAVRAITRIFHYPILISVFLIRLSNVVIVGTISFFKKKASSLVNRVTVLIQKRLRDNLPD